MIRDENYAAKMRLFSIDNRTTILNEFTLHSRNVPNRKYQNINLENFQK